MNDKRDIRTVAMNEYVMTRLRVMEILGDAANLIKSGDDALVLILKTTRFIHDQLIDVKDEIVNQQLLDHLESFSDIRIWIDNTIKEIEKEGIINATRESF